MLGLDIFTPPPFLYWRRGRVANHLLTSFSCHAERPPTCTPQSEIGRPPSIAIWWETRRRSCRATHPLKMRLAANPGLETLVWI